MTFAFVVGLIVSGALGLLAFTADARGAFWVFFAIAMVCLGVLMANS
jgi:hypothetical protein